MHTAAHTSTPSEQQPQGTPQLLAVRQTEQEQNRRLVQVWTRLKIYISNQRRNNERAIQNLHSCARNHARRDSRHAVPLELGAEDVLPDVTMGTSSR